MADHKALRRFGEKRDGDNNASFVAQYLAMPLITREEDLCIRIVRAEKLRVLDRYFVVLHIVDQKNRPSIRANELRRRDALPAPRISILAFEPQRTDRILNAKGKAR